MGRARRTRERDQSTWRGAARGRGAEADPHTSLEQESLSLRHMAASGLTPDGNLERLALELEMVRTPGWGQRRRLKVCLAILGGIVLVLAVVAVAAALTPAPGS